MKPFVYVNATIGLKNPPKGQLGIRRETWKFGTEPISLAALMASICRQIVSFYAHAMRLTDEQTNEQIQNFAAHVACWKMEPVEDEVES